jgi:hypothetical protein
MMARTYPSVSAEPYYAVSITEFSQPVMLTEDQLRRLRDQLIDLLEEID